MSGTAPELPDLHSIARALAAAQEATARATPAKDEGDKPPRQRASDDVVEIYDWLVRHTELRLATRGLFIDGYFARSVEEAFKALNNFVKRRSGLDTADGDGLMREAFSATNPRLRIPKRLQTQTERSQQRGYMDIFAGCMAGIRNPRAHEHELDDDPSDAVALLGFAEHLFQVAESATRTRQRK